MGAARADEVVVVPTDPASPQAQAMSGALWVEIQDRYGFEAPDPFDPAAFAGPVGAFWLASDRDTGEALGSVGLTPLSPSAAELDAMYVAPERRGSGVARALLRALEKHASRAGISVLRLRAGDPQPEALRFYVAAGFRPIPRFGRWVADDTARCFEKSLDPPAE